MKDNLVRSQLVAAYEYFKNAGHEHNVSRIAQLAQKLQQGEYAIAFAGHFSAGKSSMINSLLGQELLPASPIPTSANLVRVHKGEEYARAFFKKGRPRKYLAPYDYGLVRSFCTDGDQIEMLEISRQDLKLPDRVEIMDTPGIDSADDAHRLATEEALHLADLILYVMDYNHVQAELNLEFTKALTKAGKKVYLVINQIDKHVEQQLSFESFKQGTEAAFAAWGVEPAGYFYTSVKRDDLPYNQYHELKSMLEADMANCQSLLADSVAASLQKILAEYIKECEKQDQAKAGEAKALLASLAPEQLQQLQGDYQRLQAEKQLLSENWQEAFKEGLQNILDNAYLMPTSTRDLARDYLVACEPDFKVGFFGRGKKTMQEIQHRREAFFADASEKAKLQIEIHLKSFCVDFARKYGAAQQELVDMIQDITVLPPEELLQSAMRTGAKLTQDGTYVMNYTANFAEGIKNEARKQAKNIEDALEKILAVRSQTRGSEIDKQLAAIKAYAGAWELLDRQQEKLADLQQELQALRDNAREISEPYTGIAKELFTEQAMDEEIVPSLTGKEAETKAADTSDVNLARANSKIQVLEAGEMAEVKEAEAVKDSNMSAGKDDAAEADLGEQHGREALAMWSEKLASAAKELAVIPALEQLSQEMAERAQRLSNKGFMVTLFGAFSAGKSSFANALLGREILPVSPNPTTAAITKIMPVDESHSHGTVEVKLKDADMLLADINRAFRVFHLEAGSLEKAASFASDLVHDTVGKHQRERTFLRAFIKGYAKAADKLGQLLLCDLEEFAIYAAQEDKSCFVDWIQVYYDCEFTALGMTLVDTPGADSINARHTNMSFNFIRQSDAVLFVTYYNHAFSKADREFLIQLGRVKDSFALDKMFFIVNAIDLAADEAEAQAVAGYIGDQLKRYGVKKPQLFSLSSREMLQEKLAGRREKYPFEKAFYQFVFRDLLDIAINGAKGEYEMAASRLDELIAMARGDSSQKQARHDKLLEYLQLGQAKLSELSSQEMRQRAEQELQELMYYVKQRVFLRYSDFYRESFNPATLRGKADAKQLGNAWSELTESLGFDLAQELRATLLRMEQFGSRQLTALQQQANDKLVEISGELRLLSKEYALDCGLEFPTAFAHARQEDCKAALGLYKNAKDFFEGGTSKIMEQELEKIYSSWADAYLKQQQERMQQALAKELESLAVRAQKRLQRQLEEKIKGDLEALEGGLPAEQLENIREKL